jgi:hypothetical protein
MARAEGLQTAGIMDHDSIGGAEEFRAAGKIAGIGTTCGMECRVDFSETALNGKNLADLSGGQYVSVGKYNALVSERDDFKNKYNATLTDAQKAEQERIERENHYKNIERENSVYRYTQKLSSTIKDAKTLEEVASLMADGKFDDAIDRQNAYLATENAEIEKRIKDELMKNNPQPNPQNQSQTFKSKDEIMAIKDTQARQKAIAENINLFQ